MKRNAYEVVLPGGPTCILAELTPSELLGAMREAGTGPGATARGYAVGVEGVRRSLRAIDGQPITYASVAGKLIQQRLKTRHINQLQGYWQRMHLPTEDDVHKVAQAMEVETTAAGDRYRATLPDGRTVVLAELDVEGVQRVMAVGDRERAPAAQQFVCELEGVRRSVREVDGKAVSYDDLAGEKLSSVFPATKDVYLLAALWNEIHVGGAEDLEQVVQGELRAVATD